MKTPLIKSLVIASATLSPWILNAAEPPNRGAADTKLGATNAANSTAEAQTPSQAAGSRGDGVNKSDSRDTWNAELFQKLDADSNGTVSREEYDRYAATRAESDKEEAKANAERRESRRERARENRRERAEKDSKIDKNDADKGKASEGTTRVDPSKPTNSGSTTDGTTGSGSGTSSLDASGSGAGRDPQNATVPQR